MAQVGLMLEGQDGLNWERWDRILNAAETLGFQCVFRSDHFTNPNPPDKDSLELWVSLTYAATHTKRIEFGSMVAPVTFRHPSMAVRMAAAVDDLSDGRLIYGMGAGWQDREHNTFGIPFYDFPTRYAMLEDALEVTTQLLNSDDPVTYNGEHFSLDGAILLPRPARPGGPTILIGGNGPKRTLPLAAKYAKEWNAVFLSLEDWKERNAHLDNLLEAQGRRPDDVKRSLMIGGIFAKDDADLKSKLDEFSQRTGQEATAESVRARGRLAGTPTMLVDQIGEYFEAGLERIMLQWLALDDIDGIETLAKVVLPQFHK